MMTSQIVLIAVKTIAVLTIIVITIAYNNGQLLMDSFIAVLQAQLDSGAFLSPVVARAGIGIGVKAVGVTAMGWAARPGATGSWWLMTVN